MDSVVTRMIKDKFNFKNFKINKQNSRDRVYKINEPEDEVQKRKGQSWKKILMPTKNKKQKGCKTKYRPKMDSVSQHNQNLHSASHFRATSSEFGAVVENNNLNMTNMNKNAKSGFSRNGWVADLPQNHIERDVSDLFQVSRAEPLTPEPRVIKAVKLSDYHGTQIRHKCEGSRRSGIQVSKPCEKYDDTENGFEGQHIFASAIKDNPRLSRGNIKKDFVKDSELIFDDVINLGYV